MQEVCFLHVWEMFLHIRKLRVFLLEVIVPTYLENGKIFAGTILPTRVGNMLSTHLKCMQKINTELAKMYQHWLFFMFIALKMTAVWLLALTSGWKLSL